MLEHLLIIGSLMLNSDFQKLSLVPYELPAAQVNVQLLNSQPEVSATSALVYDINKNTILFQKNSNQELPIASITKLITALIINQEHQRSEIVNVTPDGINTVPVIANLRANEQITIDNLLHALLIKSANDAARTLAIHNSGSITAFAEKMNNYSQELGLKSSKFTNPSGLNTSSNTSTANDLLIIARHIVKKPELLEIVRKDQFTFVSENNNIKHDIQTSNLLLNTDYNIVGLKTGTTPEAGQCFIGITQETNPKIIILLNSPNRFQEAKLLLDWANYLNS